MSDFNRSYWGKLRAEVGQRRLLVIGTRVVVERPDGQVLLQLRHDLKSWSLPGGNAEEGESIEETATREVLEETGLVVSGLVPFGYASDPLFAEFTFPNGDACHFHSLMFVTRRFSGELPSSTAESVALAWHDPAQVPDPLPGLRASLDAFLRYRETGSFQLI